MYVGIVIIVIFFVNLKIREMNHFSPTRFELDSILFWTFTNPYLETSLLNFEIMITLRCFF